MVDYNPYAYQTHEDPYPIYAEMRARAPLYRNDEVGFWALSRHEDVLEFLDTYLGQTELLPGFVHGAVGDQRRHEVRPF